MVDRNIHIGIISTRAKQGAEEVKQALKGVQREAAQTRGAEIDITADTSGVREGVAEVQQALRSISGTSAEIPIGFDTSTIDRETAGIVNRIRDEVDRNVGNGVSVETSLDIATEAAAAEVGRMLASLPDDIDIPVDLITDTVIAELQRVFAEAERLGGVSVPVRIETPDVNEASRQTIEPVNIPLQAEDRKLEEELRAILRRPRDPINLSVTADEAGAEREIRAIMGRQRDPVELPVSAETAPANNEIREFQQEVRDPVEIAVVADTTEATRQIERLRDEKGRFLPKQVDVLPEVVAEPKPIEVPVSLDTTEAKEQMGRLRDEFGRFLPTGAKSPKVKVEADVDDVVKGAKQASDALNDIGDAAADIPKQADKAGDSLNAIQAAAARAGAAADNMSDAFKDATREMEAMELVGEALLAISTSIITAITAFEDYEDAVQAATGTTAAAEIAMAMLEEFVANTTVTLEDATAAFVELRTNGLEASRSAMESYGNVAAGLNMTMEELAEAVGEAASGNFNKLNETQLKAKESGDKVIFTYHGMTTEVKNTSSAIAGLIKQMGNTEFAGSMKAQAEGVTGAFDAMSKSWIKFSEDMGKAGLSDGLDDFATSMVDALKEAKELGEILGGWLGNQARLLGRDIEGIVDQLNDLIDIMDLLSTKIEGMPSMSSILGIEKGGTIGDTLDSITNSDFMKRAVPALFDQPTTQQAQEQGPPTDPAAAQKRAFGTDTNTPRKVTKGRSGKSDAQRQAENFTQQSSSNKEMLRTLALIDESYERGRYSVEGFRNSIEELTVRQSAQKSVGKENAEVIVEQAMAMKAYKEQIAFKGEVLDQTEAIDQTVALAEAQKEGTVAVIQAAAAQDAWNTAVDLGMSSSPELVQQLTDLAVAAETANRFLALETDLSAMDQQIESAARMATAYREGGAAIRDATLEEQVRAAAVQAGLEWDEASVQKIRDRMTALRELQEIQRSDERALMANIDMEAATAEIENLRLTGEEYMVASERLDMLTQKKRETKDASATLTPEEERLAAALGHVAYQSALANDALSQLANDGRNAEMMFRDAVAGGLGHFEDALVDIVTGAKSAKEAFADMAKAIAADLARMAIRMAIIQPLAMMFGGGFGMMGGMAGGAVVAHTGGVIGSDPLPMRSLPKFHTGGIVGDAPVTTKPYAGFPKFHTGGLASNETPAILQRGEGVFTREQMAAMQPVNNNNDNSTRGVTVVNNINVTAPAGGDRGAAEAQANNIAKMVSMAVDERLTQATRNGGILNANGGY